MATFRRVRWFLSLVWRKDMFGDPLTIETAWEVANIFEPRKR